MLLNMLRRVKRDAGLASAFTRMCRPRRHLPSWCLRSLIACLDDEEEGIRKKGSDSDWLRRRAERVSYTGIVTELAAEDPPSFKHVVRMTHFPETRPFLIQRFLHLFNSFLFPFFFFERHQPQFLRSQPF